MAVERMKIGNNKRSISVQHQKRDVATLLADKKDEKARLKVEHIIRDDFTIEACEILQLMCDLVHERLKQIKANKDCPEELREAVCSLIWAASRIDIAELREVKTQLIKKYGTEFGKKAAENDGNVVNVRLYHKMSYHSPDKRLVRAYLEEIAKAYGVEWTGDALDLPTGYSVPMAPGSGLQSVYNSSRANDNDTNNGGNDIVKQDSGDGQLPDAPTNTIGTSPTKNQNAPAGKGGVSGDDEPTAAEVEEYMQFLKNQGKDPSIRIPGMDYIEDAQSAPPEPVDVIPGTNIPVFAAVPVRQRKTESPQPSQQQQQQLQQPSASYQQKHSQQQQSQLPTVQPIVTATPVDSVPPYAAAASPASHQYTAHHQFAVPAPAPVPIPAPPAAPTTAEAAAQPSTTAAAVHIERDPSTEDGTSAGPTAPPALPTDAFADLQARMQALQGLK